MTNEEIWLYKKAQNGGKSDPNNILLDAKPFTVTANEINTIVTVEKVTE